MNNLQLQLNDVRTFCLKCGTDITDQCFNLLHELTGYSVEDLKNGSMKEVLAIWTIGSQVVKSTGIQVANEESATRIVDMMFEKFRKIQEPIIIQEKIREIGDNAKREFWQQQQNVDELREELKQQRAENKELETKYNSNLERIESHLGKFLNIPAFKGIAQEKHIAKSLKKISPFDDFSREKVTVEGEDIKSVVKHRNIEVGRIVIESKNTKKYDKDFETQIRKNMQRHQTPFGILAVRIFPDQAQDDRIYEITDDNIWICNLDFLPFAYLAVRELVIRTSELKLETEEDIDKFKRLVRKFRSIVDSKEYKDRIINIKEQLELLRDMGDKFGTCAKDHCKNLHKISENIMSNLGSLESLNSEALDLNVTMIQKET